MKRMIMALLLLASVFTAKAQFQTQLEIKGDALFDEIERLASSGDPQHFDYRSMLALLDAVITDPSFASGWSAYISAEQQQRQTTPVECTAGVTSGYNSCVGFYINQPPYAIPPGPPPPPGWSGTGGLNQCQYNFINAVNSCLGLPNLY